MDTRSRERTVELSIGYVSLALFAASIGILIWFLWAVVDAPGEGYDSGPRWLQRAVEGPGDARATFDALLVLAWGSLHSFMARRRFKAWLAGVLRPQLHAALYSIVSSAGLIALCLLYRPIPREVYTLEGGAALLVNLVFYSGWLLFVYCWFHLDLLEVVGLRPILRHHQAGAGPGGGAAGGGSPAAAFRPTGPFLWVRHPVELAFLVAFWAAPQMTVGHLLFAALMTLYTFLGADLEERRMIDSYGAAYVDYMRRVPQMIPLPR